MRIQEECKPGRCIQADGRLCRRTVRQLREKLIASFDKDLEKLSY